MTCRIEIKEFPKSAATLEEALKLADRMDDEKFLVPEALSWGSHKQPIVTLDYIKSKARKRDRVFADLLDEFARSLPVDSTVCAIHRTPQGKIYFSIDSRPYAMKDVRQHFRSPERDEKKFLAACAPVATDLLRSGIRCMAMVQHIVRSAPPGTAWQDIEFNEVSGLPMFYYAAHMQIAMGLGAFLLTHMRRLVVKEGISQVNVLSIARYTTRSQRPSEPKTNTRRRPSMSGGAGLAADVRTRKEPR